MEQVKFRTAVSKKGQEVKIYEAYIAVLAGTEWFVIKEPDNDETRYVFAQGSSCPNGEEGDMMLSDLKHPSIIKLNLNECMAPDGFEWK